MALEVTAERAVCFKCGTSYSRRKGFFPVSYAIQYKGIGYIPVCKDCIDAMYDSYLSKCGDVKLAVRQMCRKLDLFWSEQVYDLVERKSSPHSIMIQYIAKINTVSYAGKSYDDTLSKEGTLWKLFPDDKSNDENEQDIQVQKQDIQQDITDDKKTKQLMSDSKLEKLAAFWGSGYTPEQYDELEKHRKNYMSRLQQDDVDLGTEVLIKHICNLEVIIARDSAAGRPIDKSVNSLNTLLGSLNLKPAQKKNDDLDSELSNTPMGVWLYRYEYKRPLPEVDDSLRDVNHLKKYIFTWMGHLCKMLGIKNGYTKLYQDEIDRLRVDKPEYEDDDEEDLLIDSYSEDEYGD